MPHATTATGRVFWQKGIMHNSLFALSIIILSIDWRGSASLCKRESRPAVKDDSEYEICCKVTYEENGYSISHSPCSNGCCGEVDNQDCCPSSGINSEALPYVIGFSIFGVLVAVGVTILLIWVFRKAARGFKEHSSHKKTLREIYAAKSLDEVFVPSQPLVTAPGTIVHPVTNLNGPFYTRGEQPYVVPDFPHQSGASPQPTAVHSHSHNDEDDDDERWDTWDGFPVSTDQVAVSSGSGRRDRGDGGGREEEGERAGGEGRDHPYYYENYDRYAQPPPGYDEVAQ